MAKLRVVASGTPFGTPDDVEALMEAKLASSGLTLEDGKALGMKGLSAEETKTLHVEHPHLPTLFIPYYDPWTGQWLRAGPGWPELYRLRMLRMPVPADDKFPKYVQLSGSGTAAYFPRNVDWSTILTDWKVPVVITEGELKAACAGKHKLPTIGLGGVWSFKALKQGHLLLPELKKMVWPRRDTYIIFDSDSRTNPKVCAALQALAETLCDEGAIPMTVILPSEGEDEKVGLDDFIVKHGMTALEDLLKNHAEHISLAQPLWGLNKTYVYVKTPGIVVEQLTGDLIRVDNFKSHAITDKYAAAKLMANGVISRELVGAGQEWVAWPMRNEVRRISYVPGETPRSAIDHNDEAVYNSWPGWGAEPVKGDVSPFTKLIAHLFTGAEPEAEKYFWQWMAYPIAHPGTKLFVAVVIHSKGQGLGKTLVGATLGRVYGENYTMVTQENMEGAFNGWANSRQFVLIDDVTSSDRRRDIDRLKAMVTREKSWINIKNVPEFEVKDCMSLMFSSNHPDVLYLDENDRRFFIHEVTAPPLSRAFYDKYDKWYRTPEAAAALHYHLKYEVDLTGFNPNAPPPMTMAKAAMIRLAQTDIESWIRDAVASPDEFLKVGEVVLKQDFLTLAELRSCYQTFLGREPEISQIGFARKLATCGVKEANGGKNLYVPGKPLARYYVVRRASYWAKQPLDAVKRHIGGAAADARMKEFS